MWCAMARRHYRLAGAMVCAGALVLLHLLLPPDARTAGEIIVVRDQIDAWPLAYRLGEVASGQVVYARLQTRRLGCYLLNARKGQRIRVRLSTSARTHQDAGDLRLALIGPGLPAGDAPRGLTLPRGEGVQWAASIRCDSQAPPQRWQARQELSLRAPARARYVLVVSGNSRGHSLYRLDIAGAQSPRLAAMPLRLSRAFAAQYFADPNEALARLAAIAALAAVVLALWLLGHSAGAPGERPPLPLRETTRRSTGE